MLTATGSRQVQYEPWILAPFGWAGSGSGLMPEPATKAVWFKAWQWPREAVDFALEEETGSLPAWVVWLWFVQEPGTGAHLLVRHPAAEEAARPAHSPAEMVSVVRAHLSLSMVEAAAALEVERPTIYAWLAGRSEPQDRNRRRLHRLFEVARHWSRLSSSPVGGRLRHPDEHGTSLLDLLRSGRFEEAEGRLDALAKTRPAEERRRARSIQDVLAHHGLEERIRPSREEIDRLTGKRTAPVVVPEAPRAPDDATDILPNGWRQGSIAPQDLADALRQDQQLEIQGDSLLLVASHDCDVTNASFEVEPDVEFLIARPVGARNGTFTRGKNPRRLHLEVVTPDGPRPFEVACGDRVRTSRRRLIGLRPLDGHGLRPQDRRLLAQWLARRYDRAAFPSAFDARWKPVRDKIRRLLQRTGQFVDHVFITVEDTELPEGETYRIVVRGLCRSRMPPTRPGGRRPRSAWTAWLAFWTARRHRGAGQRPRGRGRVHPARPRTVGLGLAERRRRLTAAAP